MASYRLIGDLAATWGPTEFVDLTVITAEPPPRIEPMRVTVCFCGQLARVSCTTCGYETPPARARRIADARADADPVDVMLASSLAAVNEVR